MSHPNSAAPLTRAESIEVRLTTLQQQSIAMLTHILALTTSIENLNRQIQNLDAKLDQVQVVVCDVYDRMSDVHDNMGQVQQQSSVQPAVQQVYHFNSSATVNNNIYGAGGQLGDGGRVLEQRENEQREDGEGV